MITMQDVQTTPTEAGVVALAVTAAATPSPLDPTQLWFHQGQFIDPTSLLPSFRDQPKRTRGTTQLHDDVSLSSFVNRHESPDTLIFGDLSSFCFVAVFNPASADAPGWGDHSAELQLTATPEWQHWAAGSGQMKTQEEFAEHIELGIEEISEPAAADMLELAQTFHAKNDVAFRSSSMLANGERQFTYTEDLQASAGASGTLEIPKEFVLGVAPFEGTEKYRVVARLRFRLRESKLSIGYVLVRPDAVQRSAFNDVAERISSSTGHEVLAGRPTRGIL